MEELRKRYFERLHYFRRTSHIICKDLLNYRYGELYGLLDSLRILNIISFEEYICSISEVDEIYNNVVYA